MSSKGSNPLFCGSLRTFGEVTSLQNALVCNAAFVRLFDLHPNDGACMASSFCYPDLTPELNAVRPDLRGRIRANQPLAQIAWFRVGGPAQLFFIPADEADLAYCLAGIPDDWPINIIGVASNLLVRDGGLPGLTIRLGPHFARADYCDGLLSAGAAMLDANLAKFALEKNLGGLSFYRGIPGTVGGAITMNAGALDGETSQFLEKVEAVSLKGESRILIRQALNLSYRHSQPPEPLIYTRAFYRAVPDDPVNIASAMDKALKHREMSQPVKSRTGGSTFKNPEGGSAWQAIDKAGCRGLVVGDAEVSNLHCNFLINRGSATASDIETLGETVRKRVHETSGIKLEWEIKRLGLSLDEAREHVSL